MMDEMILQTLNEAASTFDATRLIQSAIAVIIAIILLIVLHLVFKKYQKKFKNSVDIDVIKRLHVLRTAYRFINVLVIILAVLAVMQINGINISAIVLVLGILAALVAVSVKDMLQDFLAGVIITLYKYFKVGDAVEYEGQEGVVISFTIRSTKIELLSDRSVLSVANRNISKIRNLTHLVDVDIPLSYDLGRREAYAALEDICARIREIEGVESCELKGTQDFDSSAILYKIRFFCEPYNRPDIRRAVLRTIQDGLSEKDIHIPYQQLDIHKS